MKPLALAGLLAGVLALAGPASAAERRLPALPAPSGPHALGTLVVDWTDEMREESWTSDPDDRRRLVVQFWYPAEARPARVPAPYVLRYPQLRRSLAHVWSEALPAVVTHAALEEPVLETGSPFPVLVFSHGMNSSRTFYTALIEELASHGYVVAAIEHTHWGPGVAFSNGRTVEFDQGMPALDWLASNQLDELVQDGIATMAEDQAFVARMLSSLVRDDRFVARELGRRMDLRRVGVLGHGMGGMAAVRSGFTYAPFKAIATMDGYAWSMGGLAPHGSPAATSHKPLLVLLSGSGVHGDSVAFARRHLAAFESPSVVRLAGTLHGSPSDWGLFDDGARRDAALAAHRRVSATVRAFFDDRLAQRGSFMATLRAVPGADPVDLTRMLNTATRAATR